MAFITRNTGIQANGFAAAGWTYQNISFASLDIWICYAGYLGWTKTTEACANLQVRGVCYPALPFMLMSVIHGSNAFVNYV